MISEYAVHQMILTCMSHLNNNSLLAADIQVGYEMTVYTTPEEDTTVELCAIIYEPTLNGSSPRPFTLSYKTSGGSARMFFLLQFSTITLTLVCLQFLDRTTFLHWVH